MGTADVFSQKVDFFRARGCRCGCGVLVEGKHQRWNRNDHPRGPLISDLPRVGVFVIGMGGGAYSFFARLSHLTIDHASLWRRSAVPTPNKDISSIRRSLCFLDVLHRNCLLSPSCFAVCGHHLYPRIEIVFSLLSSLPNSSMSNSSNFLVSSSNTSHRSLYIFKFSYYVSPTLLLCHTGAHVHPRPPPWKVGYFRRDGAENRLGKKGRGDGGDEQNRLFLLKGKPL